jgi:hypothetical protein
LTRIGSFNSTLLPPPAFSQLYHPLRPVSVAPSFPQSCFRHPYPRSRSSAPVIALSTTLLRVAPADPLKGSSPLCRSLHADPSSLVDTTFLPLCSVRPPSSRFISAPPSPCTALVPVPACLCLSGPLPLPLPLGAPAFDAMMLATMMVMVMMMATPTRSLWRCPLLLMTRSTRISSQTSRPWS